MTLTIAYNGLYMADLMAYFPKKESLEKYRILNDVRRDYDFIRFMPKLVFSLDICGVISNRSPEICLGYRDNVFYRDLNLIEYLDLKPDFTL